nr:type VI secretion system tip protein TssI/VgrG [Paracoccus sp. J56]
MTPERNITTGAIRLTDYNFKHPDQAMEVDRLGDAAHAQGQIESFDWPGDYPAQDVGKIVAGLRTSQERGADRRNRAVGDCLSLRSGRRVMLSGDRIPGTGESYLCLSASHHFVSEAYGSGGQGSDGYAFTGSYVLMPDTAPMAPPRRTHVPVVHGPQTAMVVGEGEIDCDEYGRILVRFHWDLDAAHSMRCRVWQNWAGAGWGGMVIPRIGMEVVVEFLEGDPDKPIVTGNVFNGKNGVPYELPKHKTRSTFRTNTHDGKGTGRGFNELRFEDQAGAEEIFMHAQKDMNTEIENDASHMIGRDSVEFVGRDRVSKIRRSAKEIVDKNLRTDVGGNATTTISGDMKVVIGMASGEREAVEIEGGVFSAFSEYAHDFTVIANESKGNGSYTMNVRGDTWNRIGGNATEIVTRDKTTSSRSMMFSARSAIMQDAKDVISITSGKSSIQLTSDGTIMINGVHVIINGKRIDLN